MKKDIEVSNVEVSFDFDDIEKRLLDAYQATIDCDEQIDQIKSLVNELYNREFDICDALDLINQLNSIKDMIMSVSSAMSGKITSALTNAANIASGAAGTAFPTIKKSNSDSSLDIEETDEIAVASGVEKYLATGIILKKFKILKYKLERIKLLIQKKVLEINGKVLKWMLDGKGSKAVQPIQTILNAISTTAQIIAIIMNGLSSILSMLDSMMIINVNSASTALFMTPKSMIKQDIEILNVNMSLTNLIPKPVDEAITKAEESIKESNGQIKKTKVMAAASAASASVSGGEFSYESIGNFETFNIEKIKSLVKSILMTVIGAEPVPRYEKLGIDNPNFLIYLVTGFEPKAKASFGIPGFP